MALIAIRVPNTERSAARWRRTNSSSTMQTCGLLARITFREATPRDDREYPSSREISRADRSDSRRIAIGCRAPRRVAVDLEGCPYRHAVAKRQRASSSRPRDAGNLHDLALVGLRISAPSTPVGCESRTWPAGMLKSSVSTLSPCARYPESTSSSASSVRSSRPAPHSRSTATATSPGDDQVLNRPRAFAWHDRPSDVDRLHQRLP